MSYKSLLVHVEADAAGRERVKVAVQLAKTFSAKLIGVGARSSDVNPDLLGLSQAHLKQVVEEELARAESAFKEETAGLSTDWRRSAEPPTAAMLRCACGVDLIVADAGIDPPSETKAAAADLIMGAGAPIFVAPAGAKPNFGIVLIGWKNTREARRAVWDAMPFLKRAKLVHVMRFASEPGGQAMADLISRLQLHDVNAKEFVQTDPASAIAQGVRDAATAAGAGLIVVGGYGHSRIREWVLGGVTADLVRDPSTSVLFSH